MRSWMFGGVYGTVLASARLAAPHSEGAARTPCHDAAWGTVTAGTDAATGLGIAAANAVIK
ncbi:hypothetical protein ABZY36_20330 [Streptomyces sp. NPDC006627]|uniref:hypothetical protein n=1 Tax=Streptomyces sp. NPDC006627 TaxID=3154679 RepID=UPI0033AD3687